MSSSLPSFRFRLFGFPVAIGIDFLLITLLLGLQARPGIYLLEWLVVVAVSILIHELGHAFAVRHYGINPEIRLWGMGGLTVYGYALPPRKSILVSLAGPFVGIPVALAVMVIQPWLPVAEPLAYITSDLIFINLWWGLLNLLPLAGLDGGNATTSLFLLTMGERGRKPGLAFVGVASVVVAIAAAFAGFVFLTIVILFFGLMNPEPYMALWRMVGGGRSGAGAGGGSWGKTRAGASGNSAGSGGSLFARAAASGNAPRKRGKERPVVVGAADARRVFGELYGAVVPAAPMALGAALDLDELEQRPAPLLPDVIGMVARQDDSAVAARLAVETDPLAVLGIVQRVVEAKRVPQLTSALRQGDSAARVPGLLKLQVGLHALGRFEDAVAAAETLGNAGSGESAVLEARSAARLGDKKRTAAALERAAGLGIARLSEAALGDVARLGPDRGISELLSRFRNRALGG
jgi:stage IV sporulation protein FB